MKLGISSACLYPMETEKAVRYLCENGISEIEIFFNSASEIEGKIFKEIKQIIKQNGTEVLSVHPFTSGFEPLMLFSDYERRFNDGVEFYKKYMNAANELGADIIVLHGDRKDRLGCDDRYFERYNKLYRIGRENGVYVAQENVVRCRSFDVNFISKMSNALGDEVRFVLDFKQARRSEVEIPELIKAMNKKIIHIHINDYDNQNDCLLPNKNGNCDFKTIFELLYQNGFNRNGIIEVYRQNFDEPSELAKSLEYLKEIL